ncbi:carbohydrate ABC transporter permease, partial (plasmid) [Shinella sp. B3.7]|nr:carbohydrate ABC transporter permease [Shinella sedimenti]
MSLNTSTAALDAGHAQSRPATSLVLGRRKSKAGLSWLVPTFYIVFLLLPIYWLVNMSFKTNT